MLLPAGRSKFCFCLQVITEYNDDTLPAVLQAVERMSQHLTAAVVSNDRLFQQKVWAAQQPCLSSPARRHWQATF